MAIYTQVDSEVEEQKKILPLRRTEDGWAVLTIHHSAVPGYNVAAASKGLSDDAIARELELSWDASEGKRVYPDFKRELHVSVEDLVFDPNRPLYCGWDWSNYTPAFVPTQLSALNQWLIFPGLSPSEDSVLGVYEFGQIVKDYLTRMFAIPHGKELKDLKLVHFGDPAGAAPPARVGDSPKEIRSCFDIIRKGQEIAVGKDEWGNTKVIKRPGLGWRILPGEVGLAKRLEAVRARLTLLVNGNPALVVDHRAEVIITGFLGGYCFKQREGGRYDFLPDKNQFSHCQDAIQYIATRLFTQSSRDEEDDEDGRPRQEFVSHAASRYG